MMVGAEIGQWQIDVTEKLGRLIQQTSDLTDQVKRQNGNVAKLWTEIDAVKRHPMECSLSARVAALESAAAVSRAGEKAAENATAAWKRWAERLAFAALCVFVILVLLHAPDVLKTLGH